MYRNKPRREFAHFVSLNSSSPTLCQLCQKNFLSMAQTRSALLSLAYSGQRVSGTHRRSRGRRFRRLDKRTRNPGRAIAKAPVEHTRISNIHPQGT